VFTYIKFDAFDILSFGFSEVGHGVLGREVAASVSYNHRLVCRSVAQGAQRLVAELARKLGSSGSGGRAARECDKVWN